MTFDLNFSELLKFFILSKKQQNNFWVFTDSDNFYVQGGDGAIGPANSPCLHLRQPE